MKMLYVILISIDIEYTLILTASPITCQCNNNNCS